MIHIDDHRLAGWSRCRAREGIGGTHVVREGSPLIGHPADAVDLTPHVGLTLIASQPSDAPATLVRGRLQADDLLVGSGPPEQLSRLVVDKVLAVGWPSGWSPQ